jgi:hypothetical protein
MSDSKELSKKEKNIMDTMGLDYETTKQVTEIGRLCGTHKYDVWIAREISKDNTLLEHQKDFQYIIDWARKENPDIFRFSFSEATSKSDEWHNKLKQLPAKKISQNNIDDERVVYITKDKEYFFLLLKPEELKEEGSIMKNCVGDYVQKLKNKKCLILKINLTLI